ncbi:MAG: LacI family DNA-binding transcriptional regulator [Victivallales bacterium]|nr:LacI family DNA-binding transcriptional regulator [Victivallales bacterium]
MAKKYTIRKLAAELALAPSTVYRALSGHPNVSLETRREVLRASQRQGYLLPMHEKGNIAVIVPSFSFNGYLECLLLSLEAEFHRRGFRLLLVSEPDIALLGDHVLDGIVSLVWKEGLEKLLPKKFALPIVIVGGTANTLEHIPSIMSDPKGIRLALEYLRSRGCRRIFYVSTATEKTLDASQRLAQFRQFCIRYGQDYDSMHLKLHWRELEEKFHFILEANPDACFCASETFSVRVGHLLKAAGKRIPQDISLMGLEDSHANACFTPPITAIRQNFEQIAVKAANEIVAACRNNIPPKGSLIPFTLIERQSVREPEGQ